MAKRIKAVVDRSACCAYGLCAEICPEIYKLDENGIAYTEDAVVPPELEDRAREGCDACPQMAIHIEEVES